MASKGSDDFVRGASTARAGIIGELWEFMRHNKKWWLAPIIVVLLAFGALIMLAGTAAAPFIYTLF
jgi:hypothetical protein